MNHGYNFPTFISVEPPFPGVFQFRDSGRDFHASFVTMNFNTSFLTQEMLFLRVHIFSRKDIFCRHFFSWARPRPIYQFKYLSGYSLQIVSFADKVVCIATLYMSAIY